MKQCKDLKIVAVERPNDGYVLLKLTDTAPLPEIRAGQFVEIKVDNSPSTFLRRPISVNFVDEARNELWLLIQIVGEGTRHLARLQAGDSLNVLFPLGNGFTPGAAGERVLLVGGGVGIAPLLQYAKQLRQAGATPYLLLGGRSAGNLLQLDLFRQYGEVYVTTEDGSMGEKGFVTNSSLFTLFPHLLLRSQTHDAGSSPLGKTASGALRSIVGKPHGMWSRSLPLLCGKDRTRQCVCM